MRIDNYETPKGQPFDRAFPNAELGGSSHHELQFNPDDFVLPTTAPAVNAKVGTDADNMFDALQFADASDLNADLHFLVPNDYWGEGVLELYWRVNATTGTCHFDFEQRGSKADGTQLFDAAPTAGAGVTKTVPGVANRSERTRLIVDAGNALKPGMMVHLRVMRLASVDTVAATVELMLARFLYRCG